MSGRRFVSILIAAAVAMAVALLVGRQRSPSVDSSANGAVEQTLLPALPADLNSVVAVTMRKGAAAPTVMVHKMVGQWTVAERGEYPADVAKLRKLLLELRDARIIEEKTSDPARFSVIGVQDPGQAGAPGAEVVVASAAAKIGVIVGKTVGDGNFVRRVGENRTFATAPAITLETEPRYWIDARLLDVPVALIQSIDVKPAMGAPYTLRRLNPADNSYALEGAPNGRKALDGHALAPSPSMLTGLNAEDVAPLGDINFVSASRVTVTLTDGNVITLIGTIIGEKHWLQVSSNKDAALTAKASGRAFEIASYRYDGIVRPLEQLLEPLPPKNAPAVTSKPKNPAAPQTPAVRKAPSSAKAPQSAPSTLQ